MPIARGGYGTAEVLLMELARLEAEAAAVLLVLPRILFHQQVSRGDLVFRGWPT